MALIDCPECSHKISDQSNSCPNCGFVTSKINIPKVESVVKDTKPKKSKKHPDQASFKQVIMVIIGGFLFFYFFIKSDSNEALQAEMKSDIASQSEIQIETTAEEMIEIYESNEVKGDATYKGKVIKIVGIVNSVNSDLSDEAVVMLSSGKDEYSFDNIHASGDEEFHNRAINLTKGNKVTLVCIGNGEVIGSPFLKDCIFS